MLRCHHFRDKATPIKLGKYEAEGRTDIAVDFLREHRQQRSGQPFFLMIAMGPPHDPYKAPLQYGAMYDARRLTMRPNWEAGSTRTRLFTPWRIT